MCVCTVYRVSVLSTCVFSVYAFCANKRVPYFPPLSEIIIDLAKLQVAVLRIMSLSTVVITPPASSPSNDYLLRAVSASFH